MFGRSRAAIDRVIDGTSSGGVTVNDLLMHAGSETMGFGGVGYSGTGRYKGGFRSRPSGGEHACVVCPRWVTSRFMCHRDWGTDSLRLVFVYEDREEDAVH